MWSFVEKKILTCVFLLLPLSGCEKPGDKTELVMFCAAGMKSPVSRIAEQYEREFGVAVRLQFAGSGTLLSNLQVAPGDIYLAADASYMEEAEKRGLIANTFPVATMKAGFGVPRGNPKKLRTLTDLKREGIRSAIGNPDASSIGRFTKKILSAHDMWHGYKPTVLFPTVNELANAIKLGTVDVVVLWDAVANQYPEVDFVSLPEFDGEIKDVTVAVVKSSGKAAEAERFCRYLSAGNKGKIVFRDEGYTVSTDGEPF